MQILEKKLEVADVEDIKVNYTLNNYILIFKFCNLFEFFSHVFS